MDTNNSSTPDDFLKGFDSVADVTSTNNVGIAQQQEVVAEAKDAPNLLNYQSQVAYCAELSVLGILLFKKLFSSYIFFFLCLYLDHNTLKKYY